MTKQLGAWPVSGVNIFSGEGQEINHHLVTYYHPVAINKGGTKWEGYTNWGGYKEPNFLDNMDDTKFTKKPDLPVRNDSVTSKKRRNNRGIIWMIKKRLRLNNHQEIKKKKWN